MRNVETQLGDYWAELVSDYPVPSAAELIESSAASRTGFDSTEWVASERRGDDLGVNHLMQFDEVPTRADRRRWHGLAVVASAAVLVAVGVVVAIRESSDDPVSAPAVTGPIPTVAQAEPVPSPPVTNPIAAVAQADPLPYQWSRVPHDEAAFRGAPGQLMSSVTVGGPGLVAVGSVGNDWELDADPDAAVWTSLDGLTWSRVAHDEAVFGGVRGQWMTSVTAGGPGLVAVGSDGRFSTEGFEASTDEGWYSWGEQDGAAAVWTSVDGITWSRIAHDETVFGGVGGQGMSSVTVGGPGLVAVGAASEAVAVWTSVDGITWSRVAVFGGRSQGMNSVAATGSSLVAVGFEQLGDDVPEGRGRDAAVWTSVDGITWSRVPHDEAIFGGTGNQRMHSVTVTDAGFVAVGADGGSYYTRADAVVWTSVDGVTWSRVPHDEAVFGGADMHSVTVAGTHLVAVGDQSLESKGTAERREAIESGDAVFVWLAEPQP